MSDTSANREVEDDHNSSRDNSIRIADDLVDGRLVFPPDGSGMLRRGQEGEHPLEYVGAEPVGVQIPDDVNIPPINNLPAFKQPLDQGASAGAGTSTPIPVPSQNAARKLPRELQNLATTNKPGYGEVGFESNAPRIKRKNLEVAKRDLERDLLVFEEEGEELIQLSEPFHPSNESAIVDKYAVLKAMMGRLAGGAADLEDLMEEAGATQEVALVREKMMQRERWLDQQYNKVGIAAMIDSREMRSNCSQSMTSLTSEQRRKGKIASKKAEIRSKEKVAEAEFQIETQLKQARIHLQRLQNQEFYRI